MVANMGSEGRGEWLDSKVQKPTLEGLAQHEWFQHLTGTQEKWDYNDDRRIALSCWEHLSVNISPNVCEARTSPWQRQCAEVGPFHDNTPTSVDVTLLRDRPSTEHVVSCAHRHTDASVFALGYGLSDTFSDRVLDSSNAN
jgi:hypothetical protein